MSEALERVERVAEDLFLCVVAGLSDDRAALDMVFCELCGDHEKVSNYLSTTCHEFRCGQRTPYRVWDTRDHVRLLLFRKEQDLGALEDLAYDVRFNMHRAVPMLDQDATSYLNEVFGGDYRFNAAEVGYLWRLIHDTEFPIMPRMHDLKHDVVANIASNGGVYEDFIDALNFLNAGEIK